MIIGTAGHIDHGKTTLVRALSGVDTDRLPEEKRRGISIDLGYAYVHLGDGATLGFVDVPGHERLIHTMLAGACGIDYALLVVAADDGLMPQTREHVAILDLLGVGAGAVVISKVDRVEPLRASAVSAEVSRLLASTRLAGAPHFLVNALDAADRGLANLRVRLARAAGSAPAPRRDGLFRLGVDRAFTLPGFGTVATGTVQAGEIRVGDTVSLLPQGRELRVRGLHVQNQPAGLGRAGERLALNLAGIEAKELKRGDWLADPRGITVTERVDARLRLLAGESPLGGYAPVHVHFAAKHATAHLIGLEGEGGLSGQPAWVQLVFDAKVALAPGERFVLRNAQATRTIGGGLFIDPAAPSRRRRSARRRALVLALETALVTGDLAPLLTEAPWGYSRAQLMRATARPVPARLPEGVRTIEAGRSDELQYLILADYWPLYRQRLRDALAQFHEANPAEAGPDAARLKRVFAPQAPEALFRMLLDELLANGTIIRRGAWLQLPAHGAALSTREAEAAERLLALIAAGGFDPPWARDLSKATGLDEGRVRQLLAALGRAGRIYPIVLDLYFDAHVVARLAAIVDELAGTHGRIDAAAFRDAVGIGRKRAIQILEFFDRVGYTRRVATGRLRRGANGWTDLR